MLQILPLWVIYTIFILVTPVSSRAECHEHLLTFGPFSPTPLTTPSNTTPLIPQDSGSNDQVNRQERIASTLLSPVRPLEQSRLSLRQMSISGPWHPPAPSLAALPVDNTKTEPEPAYYKLQFGDDYTGFSYYVRTLGVVIGRNVVRGINTLGGIAHLQEKSAPPPDSTEQSVPTHPPLEDDKLDLPLGIEGMDGLLGMDIDIDQIMEALPMLSQNHVEIPLASMEDRARSTPPISQHEMDGAQSDEHAYQPSSSAPPEMSCSVKLEPGSYFDPVFAPPPPPTRNSGPVEHVDVDLGPLKSVSRNHAKIEFRDDLGHFCLEITGRNGAWVDDRYYVKGSTVPLNQGSQIQIATRIFSFILPPSVDASPYSNYSHEDTSNPLEDVPYPYNLPPTEVGYAEFYGEPGPGPSSVAHMASRVPQPFNVFAGGDGLAMGIEGVDGKVWDDEWDNSDEDLDSDDSDEDLYEEAGEAGEEIPTPGASAILPKVKIRLKTDPTPSVEATPEVETHPVIKEEEKKSPTKKVQAESSTETDEAKGQKGGKAPSKVKKKVKEEAEGTEAEAQASKPDEAAKTAPVKAKKKKDKDGTDKPKKEPKKKKATASAAAADAQPTPASSASAGPVEVATLAAIMADEPAPAPKAQAPQPSPKKPPPVQSAPQAGTPTAKPIASGQTPTSNSANTKPHPPQILPQQTRPQQAGQPQPHTQNRPPPPPGAQQRPPGQSPSQPPIPAQAKPLVRPPPPNQARPPVQAKPPAANQPANPAQPAGQQAKPPAPAGQAQPAANGAAAARPTPAAVPPHVKASPNTSPSPSPARQNSTSSAPPEPPKPFFLTELIETPGRPGHIVVNVPIPPSGAGPRPPPGPLIGLDGQPFIGPPPLKPTSTFATIIHRALLFLPRGRGTLGEVCNWVAGEWEWFRLNIDAGWQNSIRHNLSLNKAFLKVPRIPEDDPESKGSVWIIDPEEGPLFEEKQRRDAQKSAGKEKNAEVRRERERIKVEEKARKQRDGVSESSPVPNQAKPVLPRPAPIPPRPVQRAQAPTAVSANAKGLLQPKAKISVSIQTLTPAHRAKSVIATADAAGNPLPFACDGTTLTLDQATFGHLTADIIDKLTLLGAAGAVDVLSAWVINKNKNQAARAAQQAAQAQANSKPTAASIKAGLAARPNGTPASTSPGTATKPIPAKPGVPGKPAAGAPPKTFGPAPPGASLTKVIGMIAEVANVKGDVNTVGPNAGALLRYIRVVGVDIDLRVAERIWATGVVPPLPPKKGAPVAGKPANGTTLAKPGVTTPAAGAARPAGSVTSVVKPGTPGTAGVIRGVNGAVAPVKPATAVAAVTAGGVAKTGPIAPALAKPIAAQMTPTGTPALVPPKPAATPTTAAPGGPKSTVVPPSASAPRPLVTPAPPTSAGSAKVAQAAAVTATPRLPNQPVPMANGNGPIKRKLEDDPVGAEEAKKPKMEAVS